jgi:5-methylcytosine-specific restriction protein A
MDFIANNKKRLAMSLLDLALEVAKNFPMERTKQFAKNALAEKIRHMWPDSFMSAVSLSEQDGILPKGSPGMGAWNESPFLAFLHSEITTSPQAGYYPVILFEQGFSSFCLVLAQGANLLKDTFGDKEALRVLSVRAYELRDSAGDWKSAGFIEGPFRTYSRMPKNTREPRDDPWAKSIAFGKRYFVDTPPSEASFGSDLSSMLRLYKTIIRKVGRRFEIEDKAAKDLRDSGELPDASAIVTGRDGAMKVANHKKMESRARNGALSKKVKRLLGYECQACNIDLYIAYGAIGENFIEAHHILPLASMPAEGAELSIEDFAVLCPTCHRMIHRLGCPSIDQLKQRIHEDIRKLNAELSGLMKLARKSN